MQPALYPAPPPLESSINIHANPLQIIRVDPSAFLEGETQVQLQTFNYEDPATISEFELLLRAYSLALAEKRQHGKPVSTPGYDVETVCAEVWKMTKRTVGQRITSGPCSEKVIIPPFEYEHMEFKSEVALRLQASMVSLRDTELESVTRVNFNAFLSFLNVDTYISNFIYHSRLLSGVNDNDSVSFLHPSQRSPIDVIEISAMKHMVQVLFNFYIQIPKDLDLDKEGMFYIDIQNWLKKIIYLWQRVATFDDHLYILTHVIGCQSIHTWGATFVQLPRSSQAIYDQHWSIENQQFFLTMLKRFLTPVRITKPSEPQNLLLEEDFIAIFRQFPFEEFMNSLFGGGGPVDMIYYISYDVVRMLTTAMDQFSTYRQFIQRSADVIRSLMLRAATYTSSLLLQLDSTSYREQAQPIKTLFDGLCSLAMKRLFNQMSCGVWQFLVFLPYQVLSTVTAYHLLNYVLTSGGNSAICTQGISPEVFMEDLTGSVHTNRQGLAGILANNPEAEFLILSWKKMALGQDDDALACIILHEIFMLGFILPETIRLQRVSRDCIQEITTERPRLLSFLITISQRHASALGDGWPNLWKRMPLSRFQPTYNDLSIIEEWIGTDYGSSHKLARFILGSLNWKEEMFIGPDVHTHVALTMGKIYAQLKASVSSNSSMWKWNTQWKPFSEFKDWLLLFLLKLKQFNSIGSPLLQGIDIVERSIEFLDLDSSTSAPHDPILSYIALLTTVIGRSVHKFMERGVYLVHSILINGSHTHVLRIIHDILPLVVDESLTWPNSNGLKFVNDILYPLLLQPTSDLSAIVSSQIMRCTPNPLRARKLVEFWTDAVFSYEGWSQNHQCLSLLDMLIQYVYLLSFSGEFRPVFEESYKSEKMKATVKTGWSFGIAVNVLVSGVKYMAGYSAGLTPSVPFSFFSLETTLNRIFEEKLQWLDFGVEFIRGTNPDLNSQVWAISETCKTCLLLKENDPAAIIWWQIFFHLYFTYITPRIIEGTSEMVGGFFAHRVIAESILEKPVDQIKRRLSYMIEYHKLEGKAISQDYHNTMATLYTAMINWIGLDLSHPSSSPENLLASNASQLLKPIIHTGDIDIRAVLWIDLLDKATMRCGLENYFNSLPWETSDTEPAKKERTGTSAFLSMSSTFAAPNAPDFEDSGHFLDSTSPELPLCSPAPSKENPMVLAYPIDYPISLFTESVTSDIRLIVNCAQNFKEILSMLHQLDANFIKTFSRLFINKPSVHRRVIKCGENQMGRVTVDDDITAWIKDHAVLKRLNENRVAAANIARTTRVEKKAIESMVKLELTISLLTSLLAPGSVKFEEAREKGSTIFYILVQSYSSDAASFGPSACFFEKYLPQLSRTFVSTDPLQSRRLLQAILSSERCAELLICTFEPNIDTMHFVDSVKDVLSQQVSNQFMERLFSRFDIEKWLKDCPEKSLHKSLLDEIGENLSPTQRLNSSCPVWKPLLSAFKSIAYHNFPNNYAPTLNFLFKKSKLGKLSPDVWVVAVEVLKDNHLQSAQAMEILKWISKCTAALRSDKQPSIYDIWQNYTDQFCKLVLALMGYVTIGFTGESETTIVELLVSLFTPWVTPFIHTKTQKSISAWKEPQSSNAVGILSAFSKCLKMVEEKSTGEPYMRTVFSFLKENVFTALAQPTYIQIQFRTQLATFPWSSMEPYVSLPNDISLLLMDLLSERGLEYCLLVEIVWSIKWDQHNINEENLATYYSNLFSLLTTVTLNHPLPLPAKWVTFLFQVTERIGNWCLYLPQDLFDLISVKKIQHRMNNQVVNTKGGHCTLGTEQTLESGSVKDEPTRMGVCLRLLRNIVITFPKNYASHVHTLTLARSYINFIVSLLPVVFHALPSSEVVVSDLLNNVVACHLKSHLDYEVEILSEPPNSPAGNILQLFEQIVEVYNLQLTHAPLELIAIVENEFRKYLASRPYLAHIILRAAQTRITFPERQTELTEFCLSSDFQHHQSWDRLKRILVVPDFGRNVFLDKALETGSVLVLATFIKQQETSIGEDMLSWVKKLHIRPGSPSEKNSLLIWEKATLDTFNKCLVSPEHIQKLEDLSKHLLTLGLDYKTTTTGGSISGILTYWSPPPSPYVIPMRLSARALGIFILSQLLYPTDLLLKNKATAIRKRPYDPVSQESFLQTEITNLVALKRLDAYKEHAALIQNIADFVINPEKTLADVHVLVLLLASSIYHEDGYTRMLLQ
eukprot:TRINITY_DN7024_c0_g1_i1.p1 TRINITY_DN7024_c0_g1~~TRINITY_DN7024_c0_g1_i1.p1  ORF type:complete len:2310 (+),score=272.97 TRINITY_DN7024_c0_g1_i1:306-6932(+)